MDDSLKNLPPQERVKALRRLQEEKKRELEELEKARKRELEETENQVKASLDDLAAEEQEAKERVEQLQEQLEDLEQHTLEETVAAERAENLEKTTNTDYHIPQEQKSQGYSPINEIVDDLNRLQYTDNWNRNDQNLYQQRKEELGQTNQYRATLGEEIVGQLDTAKNILHQLGYRH